MTGIEIAGLVLGGFPVLLEVLEMYEKSFSQAQDWWNFKPAFTKFLDEISHQRMLFDQNVETLLDPVIDNEDVFEALKTDVKGEVWKRSETLLIGRLGDQFQRYIRVLQSMNETLHKLMEKLGIDDKGNAPWLAEGGINREIRKFLISFSRGKNKRIRQLAKNNQVLKEILGFSTTVVPMRAQRRTGEPVAFYERVRQYCRQVHAAFKNHLQNNCPQPHQAEILLGQRPTSDDVIELPMSLRARQSGFTRHIVVKQDQEQDKGSASRLGVSASGSAPKNAVSGSSGSVPLSETTIAQLHCQVASSQSLTSVLTTGIKSKWRGGSGSVTTTSQTITSITQPRVNFAGSMPVRKARGAHITNLCHSVCASTTEPSNKLYGWVQDADDRRFEILKAHMPPTQTTSLASVLKSTDFERKHRMMVALVAAVSLLQSYSTPWDRSTTWKKDTIYFRKQESGIRLAFRSSFSRPSPALDQTSADHYPVPSEEETCELMTALSVIMLELTFNRPIEEHRLYAWWRDLQPYTDKLVALKWVAEVDGEAGPEVAEVVKRCLYCNFGEMPDLGSLAFRRAVHDHVIQPLQAECERMWPGSE